MLGTVSGARQFPARGGEGASLFRGGSGDEEGSFCGASMEVTVVGSSKVSGWKAVSCARLMYRQDQENANSAGKVCDFGSCSRFFRGSWELTASNCGLICLFFRSTS